MKVVWSRCALRHLTHVRAYIAQDNPDAAARIAQAILHSIELLVGQPHIGRPGRVAGTREWVVPSTPFLLAYRVSGERLELIAVLHGRRKWPDRL